MFRFAQPLAFLLLLPWLAAAWTLLRRSRRPVPVFTALFFLPDPPVTWRLRLIAAAPFLLLAGLLPAIAALARPQHVLSKVNRTTDAVAIQMVLDTSGSMEALDFSSPNALKTRLDVVKETFADFVRQRPDDLVGLIAFAGYPSTRAPLTSDHEALLNVLRTVEVPATVLGRDGRVANPEEMLTAIGDALAAACARLEKVEMKSRLIVLLSDGESNFGLVKPPEAARAARALGIRIYAIGIGSTGVAPIRARDAAGREVVAQAYVSLDENLLRQMAEETGGIYYNVRDPKALRQALAQIDTLEKTKVSDETFTQTDELFARWLAPGLLLLAAAVACHSLGGRDLA